MVESILMGSIETFCYDLKDVLKVVGTVLTIFKILIPLIIVVLGIFDLGKAAISNKPEDVKKSATTLIWRIVGGVIIFLLPSIILAAFGFIGGFDDATNDIKKSNWNVCKACITKSGDACEDAYKIGTPTSAE